jgi:hypothetical protein
MKNSSEQDNEDSMSFSGKSPVEINKTSLFL